MSSAALSLQPAPESHIKLVAPPAGHWSKRPRPYVEVASPADLAWDPVASPLYTIVDGEPVQAGSAFAICRPGVEAWPLGIVSDRYEITSHRATAAAVTAFCADLVSPRGVVIAGHGYHVAHDYSIEHINAAWVAGFPLTTRLIVSNDHTGAGAMRSSMVVYVGDQPLGSVVTTRALHVGAQREAWHGEIVAMTERSILAQDALLDLLRAANARVLADEDRAFFARRSMIVGKDAVTALDAVRTWFEGTTSRPTWGVWARRLDDTAILALCVLLGRATYGSALDAALGGHRYGGRGVS